MDTGVTLRQGCRLRIDDSSLIVMQIMNESATVRVTDLANSMSLEQYGTYGSVSGTGTDYVDVDITLTTDSAFSLDKAEITVRRCSFGKLSLSIREHGLLISLEGSEQLYLSLIHI